MNTFTQFTRRIAATVAMILCTTTLWAHDFEVNGIFYKITSETDLTVKVTYNGASYSEYEYSGKVVIPKTMTYNSTTYTVISISWYAFYQCYNLTSVTIPNSVTSIGRSAFYNCGLTSITIPNSVTSIGCNTFYGCTGLTSINIPNSVTSIGGSAFSDCTNLTTATISSRVDTIADYTFNDCDSLKTIVSLNTTPPILGSDNFPATDAVVYVPQESFVAYWSDSNWSKYNIKILSMATSVSLPKPAIAQYETVKINPIFTPSNPSIKTLAWVSDNPEVATVDSEGRVYGVAPGTATITATTIDGSNITASCNVTVKSSTPGITLNPTVVHLQPYATTTLTYTLPSSIGQEVTWSSSNEAVAVVRANDDGTATILALSAGVATITVTSATDATISAKCKVTVSTGSGVNDATAEVIEVLGVNGNITITGAENKVVTVYNTAGQQVYNGYDTTIPIATPGLYIVTIAGKSYKVVL